MRVSVLPLVCIESLTVGLHHSVRPEKHQKRQLYADLGPVVARVQRRSADVDVAADEHQPRPEGARLHRVGESEERGTL